MKDSELREQLHECSDALTSFASDAAPAVKALLETHDRRVLRFAGTMYSALDKAEAAAKAWQKLDASLAPEEL